MDLTSSAGDTAPVSNAASASDSRHATVSRIRDLQISDAKLRYTIAYLSPPQPEKEEDLLPFLCEELKALGLVRDTDLLRKRLHVTVTETKGGKAVLYIHNVYDTVEEIEAVLGPERYGVLCLVKLKNPVDTHRYPCGEPYSSTDIALFSVYSRRCQAHSFGTMIFLAIWSLGNAGTIIEGGGETYLDLLLGNRTSATLEELRKPVKWNTMPYPWDPLPALPVPDIPHGPLKRTLVVLNNLGLHARPTGRLIDITARYQDTEIMVECNGITANAKSAIGVMFLTAGKGTEMTFSAEGPDAERVLNEIEMLFMDKFGEE